VIEFGQPETLDAVLVTSPLAEANTYPEIDLKNADGAWTSPQLERTIAPPTKLRFHATRYLRKLGVTHIVVAASTEGVGVLGNSLVSEADDWNLDVVANHDAAYLLRIRQIP
jgi:hypothetical protein